MACGVVQSLGAATGGTGTVSVTGLTITAGNLIHADGIAYTSGGTNMSVSDSQTQTWNVGVASHTDGGSSFSQTVVLSKYVKNCAGGATNFTMTATNTGFTALTLNIVEISGADTTAPLGTTGSGSTTAGNTTSPSISTAGSASVGDIAISALGNYNAGPSITEASGWTTQGLTWAVGGGGHTASLPIAGAGVVTYNPTTSSTSFVMQITTYLVASAGGDVLMGQACF